MVGWDAVVNPPTILAWRNGNAASLKSMVFFKSIFGWLFEANFWSFFHCRDAISSYDLFFQKPFLQNSIQTDVWKKWWCRIFRDLGRNANDVFFDVFFFNVFSTTIHFFNHFLEEMVVPHSTPRSLGDCAANATCRSFAVQTHSTARSSRRDPQQPPPMIILVTIVALLAPKTM